MQRLGSWADQTFPNDQHGLYSAFMCNHNGGDGWCSTISVFETGGCMNCTESFFLGIQDSRTWFVRLFHFKREEECHVDGFVPLSADIVGSRLVCKFFKPDK
jgi:hypothetical protein